MSGTLRRGRKCTNGQCSGEVVQFEAMNWLSLKVQDGDALITSVQEALNKLIADWDTTLEGLELNCPACNRGHAQDRHSWKQ